MEFFLICFVKVGIEGFFYIYKEGEVKYEVFLDDYVFLIELLILLYEISFNSQYFDKVLEIMDFVLSNFFDSQYNLFYFILDK